jgi:hypothetical protein
MIEETAVIADNSTIAERPIKAAQAGDIVVPLILRGQIIEDNLISYRTRAGGTSFMAPDVKRYLPRLVLQDPVDMSDLYALSIDNIVDFLVELGLRMDMNRNPHVMRAYEISSLSNSVRTADITRGTFKALPGVLKREVIEEVLEYNVGRAYLEGWVTSTLGDGRSMSVRAFGARTAHIIAGNGSVIALQTFMYNALTRGDAIIKLPSNDPYFSTAVARTMIEMAPEHPLTKHVSVAYWKGGDATVESYLYDYKHLEKIVAWGGFDSMRSVRQYLQPGIDLIALDPKLSGSIVGSDAFASETAMQEAAALAARDIGYFNQGGCVSARTLYVVTGTDGPGIELANRFGRLVFDAIQALPSTLSTPVPSFDPQLRDEIEGIRYSDGFRVIGGRANEGAIIVSQADETVDFSERLDGRVANVVPVADVDAALLHLTVHTQTIGIYPESLKRQIRDSCALRGGQRIVPLGFATAGTKTGPHDAVEVMRRMVRWIRDDTMTEMRGTLFADD